MTGEQVPREATPLGELELAAVLRDAHHGVVGGYPTGERLAAAWAHVAFEHARGAAVWCHNLGNISCGREWGGPFYVIRVQEQTDPGNVDPSKRWRWVDMKFRAHADAIDGGRGYWSLLTGKDRSVLPYFDAGDLPGAAAELKRLGYYTASVAPYATGIRRLYAEAIARILPRL